MPFTGPFEDRLCIHELVAAYADAITMRDAQGWKSLWAEDSEWCLPVVPGFESVKGREAIFNAWNSSMELYSMQMIAQSSLGMLQINGDEAIGRAYPRELMVKEDGTYTTDFGRYDDEYIKIDGQWLFKRRTHTILYQG